MEELRPFKAHKFNCGLPICLDSAIYFPCFILMQNWHMQLFLQLYMNFQMCRKPVSYQGLFLGAFVACKPNPKAIFKPYQTAPRYHVDTYLYPVRLGLFYYLLDKEYWPVATIL